MAITLNEARATVLASILHAPVRGESYYERTNLDRVIRFAGHDFAEATRAIRGTTNVTLSSGSHIVDITATSGMENFREPCFLWAHIDGAEVELAPLHTVQRRNVQLAGTDQPTMLAFEGPTRMWLYPEPDAGYTLTVFWWQPFSTWTYGDCDDENINLNLPVQYADGVLRLGAATALRYSDPEVLHGQIGWQEYLRWRDGIASQYRPEVDYPVSSDPDTHKDTTLRG